MEGEGKGGDSLEVAACGGVDGGEGEEGAWERRGTPKPQDVWTCGGRGLEGVEGEG